MTRRLPHARSRTCRNIRRRRSYRRETLPAAWRGSAPVLCIAGRGPLDEAAASMLSQLLHKNGLKARVLPHAAVSRGRIGSLEADGRSDGMPVLP